MKKIYICPEMFSEEVSAACALLQESKSEGLDLTKSELDGSNPSDGFGTKDRGGDFGDDSWGSLW
jgi:hypothetical protein